MTIFRPENSADLSAIVPSSGDTILLKSNVVYSAAAVPSALLSPSNITLGCIGSGGKAIISGGVERSDWTFDNVNNVYSRPAYGSNILGNVTEDGVPMKHVPWNTDIATTAAAMPSGGNGLLWQGSMTFDTTNFIVYIKPSMGLASEHKYIVSETNYCLRNVSTSENLKIDGIRVEAVSIHGMLFINKKKVKISLCDFFTIGGGKPGGSYVGNGIELSAGVIDAETTKCNFYDIFDSPVTSQLYESSPAIIGDHLWQELNLYRYGMHGVEISCQTQAHQYIRDIEINRIKSWHNGVGWGGDRNGAVITNLTQGGTSRITRSFASEITGHVQKRLYMGFRTGGVNGIQDAVGTETFGQGVRSDQSTGLYVQTDLKRNVTDSLAQVGTSWVDVEDDIRNGLSGF